MPTSTKCQKIKKKMTVDVTQDDDRLWYLRLFYNGAFSISLMLFWFWTEKSKQFGIFLSDAYDTAQRSPTLRPFEGERRHRRNWARNQSKKTRLRPFDLLIGIGKRSTPNKEASCPIIFASSGTTSVLLLRSRVYHLGIDQSPSRGRPRAKPIIRAHLPR
jgi:hypothetical protein